MNANFTRQPTFQERQLAAQASERARKLVKAYADEVDGLANYPNRENVENTETALLAYIAKLETQ